MNLIEIRRQIDAIDQDLISLLKERFDLVLKAKDLKPTLTDSRREEEILHRIESIYVKKIYQNIFLHSKQMLIDQGFQ